MAYSPTVWVDDVPPGSGTLIDAAKLNKIEQGIVAAGAGHTILDETTPLTSRSKLAFVGSAVAVTDDAANDKSVVTIAGGVETLPATILDAKGDLIAASANDTAARLPVGADGQVLIADSSQPSGMRWATPAAGGGALAQIADITLGATTATIDFAAVPGTYNHLLLQMYLRGDTAALTTVVSLRFNNDSGANYDRQYLVASDVTVSTGRTIAGTSTVIAEMPAATAGANFFSANSIEIPNYANVTNHKSVIASTAMKHTNATNGIEFLFGAGFWRSANAINRVTLLPAAGNFVAGSRATLYGMT